MKKAERLIKELGKLMGKTDTQSTERRAEIATWFRENKTPENDALFSEFIETGVSQIAEDIEIIRNQLDTQDYRLLPMSFIASHYFGKSSSWLSQRLNGTQVRGRRYTLNEEQRTTFNNAVQEVAKRIGSICI